MKIMKINKNDVINFKKTIFCKGIVEVFLEVAIEDGEVYVKLDTYETDYEVEEK